MNVIFTGVVLLSACAMCICAPADFLPALLQGTQNAAKCALTLFCIYAVWMGLSAVAEDCRITDKLSALLFKPCRRLFKTDDKAAVKNISMNISCNLLGLGGAATPYGVKAIERLEKDKNYFAQNLLFVINATSIQLIPTTVIALRAAGGSLSAHDIVLPSLLATLISTGLGVGLFLLFTRVKGGPSKRKKELKKAGAL